MKRWLCMAAMTAALMTGGTAGAAALTFDQLTGVTGGTVQGTAVFRADLSGIGGTIQSITIRDNSSGLGGSAGQFSGFDLDAIKLSTTSCATAACAAGLAGLGVFDFVNGVVFSPGTQRVPVDPKLFGTGAGGTTVDNMIATLGAFDGENTTVTPSGFLSLGDNGVLSFNLTSAVATAGLYLYIGEVGNQGEIAAGSIEVGRDRVDVPEPASLGLLGLGLAGLGALRRRRG